MTFHVKRRVLLVLARWRRKVRSKHIVRGEHQIHAWVEEYRKEHKP